MSVKFLSSTFAIEMSVLSFIHLKGLLELDDSCTHVQRDSGFEGTLSVVKIFN